MNYQETQVSGSSFIRCRQVEINNSYNQLPAITFTEERITTVGTDVIRDQTTAPMRALYDPGLQIALVDPETLLSTEATVSMEFLYLAIFSAYMHYANSRDALLASASEILQESEPVVEEPVVVP